ncbi:MAG: hypothetical protein HFI76_08500 [Lachnospiraceae bacterium]|jgi:hypothetical protein|nr:hypothetical protein [Lachnospiraceae bacterium]
MANMIGAFFGRAVKADEIFQFRKIASPEIPEKAISQIKEKQYALRFQGKLGEKQRYTGRVLAVGISYNKKTKEHRCKVEEI